MKKVIIYEKYMSYHRRVFEIAKLFYEKIEFQKFNEINSEDCFVIVEENVIYINNKSIEDINKSNIKKILFLEFVKLNKYHPPFGTMTGIRPTKPGFRKYLKNKNLKEIEKMYKDKYFLSEDSVNTIIEVIKKEEKLLNEPVSLYISIPFCPSFCNYCTFSKTLYNKELANRYLDRLIKEIKEKTKGIRKNIDNIYIGGGTPGVLDLELIVKLLNEISDIKATEYTFEAGRCDIINYDKLLLLDDFSVNRICINPQTMNDTTLKKIGREHTVKEFIDTFEMAKKFNWTINSDLIFGFKNENLNDMSKSLNEVLDLNPDNITIHPLAYKKHSGIEILKRKNSDIEFWRQKKEILKNKGYSPYYLYRQKTNWNNFENVGFSLNSKECIYNMQSIEQIGSIIGTGVGAMSLEGGVKTYNTLSIKKYINEKAQ